MDGSIARPRPLLALFVRLLAAFALATMAMLVKLAGQRGAHLIELIFWRQALTMVLLGAGMAVTGKLAMLKTQRLPAHARRAASGLFGMIFTYGAVLLLPLAEATTLGFTAPVFAVLIAMVLFAERIGPYRWAAIAMGFAGVVVVMQPFGALHEGVTLAGIAVGLVAPFMVALISFQLQDLNTTENPWSIVFWFAALTTPVAALALPFVIAAHDSVTWSLILGMGFIGAMAQMLLTTSLRFGSAAVILLMDYTALLWATYYGAYVFDTAAPASLWLGAPLIIGAGLLIAWREHRLAKAKRVASAASQE
ncbi:DMT family transporter [Erythrobacter sp. BLCC-B19]|uniref:DMT family transporter n=1 Tax=Erythrobacter sp. BLCC-B19 TaxID=3025315 RepID=UPI00235F1E90|nr:DMT family transporter [Erythrobacter sp. BLCC-B19]WDA40070.1 DMT family transporter [Erythrobacter sp. BLCC-B19]